MSAIRCLQAGYTLRCWPRPPPRWILITSKDYYPPDKQSTSLYSAGGLLEKHRYLDFGAKLLTGLGSLGDLGFSWIHLLL